MSKEDPVVCRQWNSIIAVSYAARKFGISRIENITSAKQKCPQLICPHVATYKKGTTHWDWYEEPNPVEYKVSLDPFRSESRKILKLFKNYCPWAEKASIDEMFLDLGPFIYREALRYFDELSEDAIGSLEADDPLPALPVIPEHVQWIGKVYGQDQKPSDWDDVFFMLASMYLDKIRQALLDEMGYTSSAGLAVNKFMAKLGSGMNKPNNQTIVPNSSIQEFLTEFSIKDFWGLGGKYGQKIIDSFNVPEQGSIPYLRNFSVQQLQEKLGEEDGIKLYNLLRGISASEITARIDIKTMQSVKQFGSKGVKTLEDCKQWLRVYSADLRNRVFDLDAETSTIRRPKRITIGYRLYRDKTSVHHDKQMQCPSLQSKSLEPDEFLEELYRLSVELLQQVIDTSEHTFFPCSMLSLSLGSFEAAANNVIEGFFQKGTKPNKLKEDKPINTNDSNDNDNGEDDSEDDLFVSDSESQLKCSRCGIKLDATKMGEHSDWHYAKDLQQGLTGSLSTPSPSSKSTKRSQPSNRKPPSPNKKSRNDQSILKFFTKN